MKGKKTFIGLVIFIAVLVLGVGYATISDIPLTISGTASAESSDDNFNVHFDDTVEPTVTKSKETIVASASITDSRNASITIDKMTAKNDEVTALYTIKNDSPDLSADLNVEVTNTNTTYFDVTYELVDETLEGAGKTTTIKLIVKLKETPIGETAETGTVGATITASPVQPPQQ